MKSASPMNPLKKRAFALILTTAVLLISCSEDVLTPGELTGRKIKEVVKQYGIEKASVYMHDETSNPNNVGVPFKVEGSFLVTYSPTPTYYDLTKLIRFVPYTNGAKKIDFYFE